MNNYFRHILELRVFSLLNWVLNYYCLSPHYAGIELIFSIMQQEDIRNFIDNSLKHGIQLTAFRKERIGGDSHGISYWYHYYV